MTKSWIAQFLESEMEQRLKRLTPAQEKEFAPLVWAGLIKPGKSKIKSREEMSISDLVAEKLENGELKTKRRRGSTGSLIESLTSSIDPFGPADWLGYDEKFDDARASEILEAFEQLMQRALRDGASKIEIKKIIAGFNTRISRLTKSKDALTRVIAKQYLMLPRSVLLRLNIKPRDVDILLD